MKVKEEKGSRSVFKEILLEIRDSIIFEIVWNILMLIPRILIRLIKNLF
ncbi:hypothetical protein J2S02_004047 [Metabacillus niabensis]|uniref:Uncharacterized protein n=1 Tax=Metabacillus niabensis TaxID=324854 RepID=A0ABT9Z6T6_9BACI|nr:hypothetical protein [Metabacillus niabensis]